MTTIKFSKNSDPFKKYWWVLLLIFSAVGVWVSYPSYQSGQGLNDSAFGRNLMTVKQSLNSLNNPEGAPGSPLGVPAPGQGSGQGAYQKEGGAAMDGLFPHPEAAKKTAAKPRSFADDLAAIAGLHGGAGGASALSGAAASAPEIPVESPSLGSGFSNDSGGGGGGGSGASYSPPPIAALGAGAGAFNEGQTQTSLQNASDLSGQGAPSGGNAMAALQAAAKGAVESANAASNAAAASGLSTNFDGLHASGQIGAMGGQSGGGVGIGNGGTPMNLKQNPTNLTTKKVTPPTPMPVTPNSGNTMMQMMMMMLPMLMMGMMGM